MRGRSGDMDRGSIFLPCSGSQNLMPYQALLLVLYSTHRYRGFTKKDTRTFNVIQSQMSRVLPRG